MPVFPPLTPGERVQALKHRAGFERAQRSWFRTRTRELRQQVDEITYRPVGRPRHDFEPHVVVVPQEGRAFSSFRAGTRNFYFEAWRSLAEATGDDHVSVFNVDPDENPGTWHRRLLDYLLDVGATHMITHIESDPGSEGMGWSWDSAWALISRHWDGVLLGVMFDSAFEWIAAKSRLLARISPRFMVVDICMPMDGSMKRGRPEVGPLNMPVSRESLSLVVGRLADVSPVFDVSFVGVMYPYRMQLVDRLRASGISVSVNPHRPDAAADDAGSRVNQPGWLDYMAGLASSRMTLNFSQSSAGRFEQLKTRVIEATLAGTLLLTDDVDRTRRFWVPGEEYVYFRDVAALPRIVSDLRSDPERVKRVAVAGQKKALSIAHTNFWGGIDKGLHLRGLPLTGFSDAQVKG